MPSSPYQVTAGTMVAGALVTGIKSALPGDVVATVTELVDDLAMGKFLLIPRESRILGIKKPSSHQRRRGFFLSACVQ